MLGFIVKVLLFMFVLPALGLLTFTGGLGTGLLAALLVGVVGFVAVLALFPLLAGTAVIGNVLSGAVGGIFGVVLFNAFFGALVYGLAIAGVAWLLPGIALISFWHTVGAGAVLGVVNAFFSPSKSN